MVIGMFQSPLVPLGTYWFGSYTWQPMGMSFLLCMFFLVRSPTIWWIGNLFNVGLLVSLVLGTFFCLGCIPLEFQVFGLIGILSSTVILWLFSLQSTRRFYFPASKTT